MDLDLRASQQVKIPLIRRWPHQWLWLNLVDMQETDCFRELCPAVLGSPETDPRPAVLGSPETDPPPAAR